MADLVGRRGELDAIAALIAAARSGRGGLLTVSGPPGSGRSAILLDAAARARGADVRVLAARATQLDQESGLGLLRRVLLPLVEADPDLLVGGPAAWAGPLFSPGTAEVDHLAVSQGLISVLGRAGEGRGLLAIVLDDLHLADRASVRVLAEVARAAPDLPLALVVSVVEGRSGGGLAGLVALGTSHRIDRLDRAAVAELASERLGGVLTEDLLIALESDTGGLPAVLVPVLAGLAARGGDARALSIVDVAQVAPLALPAKVDERLDEVSAEARMLALAVAVLGADARIDVVAAAVGLDPAQVAPLVAELVDAGLFEPGARLAWTLPLLARAALDLLPSGRRGLVAVGAARAMAAAGDPPDQVASLLIGAPVVGEPWAAAALAAAATEAERRGAPEVAKDLWLRQLDEPLDTFSRGWATASVARAELHLGDPAGAARLDDLAPLVDDPGLRSRVRFAAARAFLWNAEADRSAACFGAAAADARIAGEEEVARRSEAGALLASGIGGLGDDRVALLAGALPASDGTAASSSQVCGRALASLVAHDDADEVRALARGGLADERLYVLPTSDFTAITAAAFCLSTTGATSEAIEALDRVIGAAHQIGQLSTVATVSASRAGALLAAGRVSEAADSAELALGAAHAWPIERPSAAAALAEVHRLHGDLDRAIRTLAEHPTRSDGGPLRTAELQWLVVAARVAIDRREPVEGRALAERALAGGGLGAALGADLALAQALVADGAAEEAAAVLDQAAGGPSWRSVAAQGSVAVLAGRIAGDLEQVQRGIALLRAGTSPVELVDGLIALGHELLRLAKRAPARDAFREALGLADALGTKGQASIAIDGLRLAGGRPRRHALVGVASLTPGEERICRLVAGGMSNRGVADALFVSRKTVEYHLGNAYGKLGITRRDQLAAALGGDQPAPARP